MDTANFHTLVSSRGMPQERDSLYPQILGASMLAKHCEIWLPSENAGSRNLSCTFLLLKPPQLTKIKALEVWGWVRAEVVTFWSCFHHFYKGKLGKTGRLLLWKCAWGSCMTDPWTSLLSWTSLTSTTGDSRETVWHGDAPGGGSFARPSTQGGTTRGQIRTNEKETFNRRFFRCKQDYSHKLGLLNVHVSRPTAVWRAAQGS